MDLVSCFDWWKIDTADSSRFLKVSINFDGIFTSPFLLSCKVVMNEVHNSVSSQSNSMTISFELYPLISYKEPLKRFFYQFDASLKASRIESYSLWGTWCRFGGLHRLFLSESSAGNHFHLSFPLMTSSPMRGRWCQVCLCILL